MWQPVTALLPPLRVDSVALGNKSHMFLGVQKQKDKGGPPSSFPLPPVLPLPPPFILLIMRPCQVGGGSQKSQNKWKHPDFRQAWSASTGSLRALHKQWLTPTQATTFFNRWKAYTDCTQTAQTQSAHLESLHCANMGRGLPFLSRTCKPIDWQRKQTPALSVFTHRPPLFFLYF